MMATRLPSVLQRPHGNSISVERALKQIVELLEVYPTSDDPAVEDRINASLDDAKVMLACVDRG